MIAPTGAVLFGLLAAVYAATIPQKRALETYSLPYPIISFPENTGRIYVETIKSLSPPSSRYLPSASPIIPINVPTSGSEQGLGSTPISVSFNAFEAPSKSSSSSPSTAAATTATGSSSGTASSSSSSPAPSTTKSSSAAEPTTATSTTSASAASAAAATPARKRPSGGLGGFTYYGGAKSSSSSGKSDSSSGKGSGSSTSTSAPTPAPTPAPTRPNNNNAIVPSISFERPQPKPVVRNNGYDYPTPKNNRKPNKKEQRLADSKPEESEIGYRYEIGLPSIADSTGAITSGGTQVASSGMGLSYMRQSSPFFSYHVMLD